MRTLQNWKESWESMPRTWFFKESWWIHTQSLLLYENSKFSPYSLSKIVINFNWNDWMGFYTFLILIQLASRVYVRHGELMFLHQWVSATSALRSFWPPWLALQDIVRHCEFWYFLSASARLGLTILFAIARFIAFYSPLWVGGELSLESLPMLTLDSPLARHGELTFAQFLCFSFFLGVLKFESDTNGWSKI